MMDDAGVSPLGADGKPGHVLWERDGATISFVIVPAPEPVDTEGDGWSHFPLTTDRLDD